MNQIEKLILLGVFGMVVTLSLPTSWAGLFGNTPEANHVIYNGYDHLNQKASVSGAQCVQIANALIYSFMNNETNRAKVEAECEPNSIVVSAQISKTGTNVRALGQWEQVGGPRAFFTDRVRVSDRYQISVQVACRARNFADRNLIAMVKQCEKYREKEDWKNFGDANCPSYLQQIESLKLSPATGAASVSSCN